MTIPLPEALVEAVALRVAEMLGEQPEAWIGVEQAADYLDAPKSRIYRLVSQQRIPHVHDGKRVLFRRSELDRWLAGGGA